MHGQCETHSQHFEVNKQQKLCRTTSQCWVARVVCGNRSTMPRHYAHGWSSTMPIAWYHISTNGAHVACFCSCHCHYGDHADHIFGIGGGVHRTTTGEVRRIMTSRTSFYSKDCMSDVMYVIRDHVREWRSHASQCIEANQLQLSHIIRANASHPPVLIEMFGEHFLANIYDFQFASRYTDADACSNIAQYRSSISFSLYHYSVIALQSPVGHRSICPQRPLPTIVLLFVRPHNDRQQPSYPEYADPSPKLHTTDNTKKKAIHKIGRHAEKMVIKLFKCTVGWLPFLYLLSDVWRSKKWKEGNLRLSSFFRYISLL